MFDAELFVRESLEGLRPYLGTHLDGDTSVLHLTGEERVLAQRLRAAVAGLGRDAAATLKAMSLERDPAVRARFQASFDEDITERGRILRAAGVALVETRLQRAYDAALDILERVLRAAAKALLPP